MKALLVLLGLITASLLSGVEAATVMIRAYNATGDIVLGQENVTRGIRLLLICDVEGLPEGNVVISYTWYSYTTERYDIPSKIQMGDPYYLLVNDTLLVDATSWGGSGRRRHVCEVKYLNNEGVPITETGSITHNLTDTLSHFLLTPTSLLPNHTLITDVQPLTGSEGEQWIKCTKGEARGIANIKSVNGTDISTNIGTGSYPSNGLYHCSAGAQNPPQYHKHYVSLFLNMLPNSSYLPTPTASAQDSSKWTLTSPDGSQVERYIVEFECRVRNMIFVEKYMSISASGGTGRVATSVSCFGGLGQLYRVKVWAVSGTNISRRPAVKLVNTDGPTLTTQVPTSTPTTRTPGRVTTSSRWPAVKVVDTLHGPTPTTQVMMSTPTTAGSTTTPSSVTTRRSYSSSSSVTPSSSAKEHERPTLTTQVMMSTTTTAGSTATPSKVTTLRSRNISSSTTTMDSSNSRSSVTPSSSSEQHGDQAGFGTFIGVGVGIGMLLFIVVLALVGVIVAVVMVKRRAANKKTGSMKRKMRNNPSYSNPVTVELEVKGLGADYADADKDKANASVVDGFNPYEDVDSKAQMKNTKKPAPKESSSPASATNAIYAIVDKSKKKGAKQKQEEDGCTLTNKDDLYTVPMKKSKMADGGKAASGCAEKSEDYDDVAELKYEPKVDSESRQPSEEDSKAPKVDMLYAVVDKSRKKKM